MIEPPFVPFDGTVIWNCGNPPVSERSPWFTPGIPSWVPRGLIVVGSLLVDVQAEPSKAEVGQPVRRECIVPAGGDALIQRGISAGKAAQPKSRTPAAPKTGAPIKSELNRVYRPNR